MYCHLFLYSRVPCSQKFRNVEKLVEFGGELYSAIVSLVLSGVADESGVAVELAAQHQLGYWITDGTLLGSMRDGMSEAPGTPEAQRPVLAA